MIPPALPADAFARQRARLAEMMARAGFDLVVAFDPLNVTYLTGYRFTPNERPAAAIVTAAGEATLVVPLLKAFVAADAAPDSALVVYEEFPGTTHPMRTIADEIGRRRPARALLDRPLPDAGQGFAGPLLAELIAPVPCTLDPRPLQRLRAVKSAEEIALVRAACRWCARAEGALEAAVAPGRRESEIAAAAAPVAAELRRAVADRPAGDGPFRIAASFGGQVGPDGTAHHRPRAIDPVLQPGDLLITQVVAAIGGYHGEVERTLTVGEVSPQARELLAQGGELHALALALIRPGVSCAEIDRRLRDEYARRGLTGAWRHHVGHGIGLEPHETPFLDVGSDDVLEPGMIVTVEPGLYRDGLGGTRRSDCVLVTATGAVVLD